MESEATRSLGELRDRVVADDTIDSILAAWRDPAFRLALKIMGSRESAEDVTQEALIRMFEARQQIRSGPERTAWMRRIVTRCALNALRAERRPEGEGSPLPAREDPTTHLAIRQVLQRLSPEQRTLLALAGEGLTHNEVSDILHVPPGTVASRLHKARKRVQELWGDHES